MSSLVEVEPYSLAVAEPNAAHGEAGDARRETNLMQLAWRSRWLILVCMLAGALVSWVLLKRVTPLFPAASRIYVDRQMPQLLTNEFQIGQTASYLYTQTERIRSTSVLAAVANDEKNAGLRSFRDVDNRVGFLKDVIQATVGTKDDIITVRAELPDAQDAAQLVNSCVESYITQYADNRKESARDVLDILRKEKERRDSDLEKAIKDLADFRKQHTALAITVQDENVVIQRFAEVSAQKTRTEIELLDAKARYNHVKSMYDTPSERPYLLEAASRQQTAMRDMDLERQLQQEEQQLNALRVRWGEGHPHVKLLRESHVKLQDKLKKQQDAIMVAYVEGLRQE